MADAPESQETPDYSNFNIDSVPPEEIPIEKKHPGRPDLDYDDTVVGPAPTGEE